MKTTLDRLEDKTDYWSISPVTMNIHPVVDGVYLIKWYKELFSPRTIDGHAEHRNQVLTTNEPYASDSPSSFAVFKTLFDNKDNPKYKDLIEQFRKHIQSQLRFFWNLKPLSKITNNPVGFADDVIHNYKQPDQYIVQAKIVGKDRRITSMLNDPAYKAVTGLDGIELEQLAQWINQTPIYISRINKKPEESIESAIVFGAKSDGFYIFCGRMIEGYGPAFGIRAQKIS